MINYSKTILNYNIFFIYMVPYAIDPANSARLGLTPAQVAALTAALAIWKVDYEKYINPATYSRVNTATINGQFRNNKTITNGIGQQLKSNSLLVLTELEYILFDIHKDATPRSNIPKPTQEAGVTIKTNQHLNHEYHVFDLANMTSGAKPKDVKRIKVVMLVLDKGKPEPTIDQLLPEMESGTMNFDIPFAPADEGKIAYLAVCFSNDSGDGLFSAIIANPII